MKIPIKEAVISGDWLTCSLVEFNFKIRLLSFKVEPSLGAESLSPFINSEDLWHLKIDFINLSKSSFSANLIVNNLLLVDQDDYEFESVNNDLAFNSDYAINNKLNIFHCICPKIRPKIKTTGGLAYQLPLEEADYFISLKGGLIEGG